MRHWNLLCLVALLAAALIAVSGAGVANAADTSTSTNFKGKAAVYDRVGPAYFVVNFTCSNGQLNGNWTWEDTSGTSHSGTLSSNSCAVSVQKPWSPSFGQIMLTPQTVGPTTLNLVLSNITRTKTYVSDTTSTTGCASNPTNNTCIVLQAPSMEPFVFDSTDPSYQPYGTLTLSVR